MYDMVGIQFFLLAKSVQNSKEQRSHVETVCILVRIIHFQYYIIIIPCIALFMSTSRQTFQKCRCLYFRYLFAALTRTASHSVSFGTRKADHECQAFSHFRRHRIRKNFKLFEGFNKIFCIYNYSFSFVT